jgi:hypothetical protein
MVAGMGPSSRAAAAGRPRHRRGSAPISHSVSHRYAHATWRHPCPPGWPPRNTGCSGWRSTGLSRPRPARPPASGHAPEALRIRGRTGSRRARPPPCGRGRRAASRPPPWLPWPALQKHVNRGRLFACWQGPLELVIWLVMYATTPPLPDLAPDCQHSSTREPPASAAGCDAAYGEAGCSVAPAAGWHHGRIQPSRRSTLRGTSP